MHFFQGILLSKHSHSFGASSSLLLHIKLVDGLMVLTFHHMFKQNHEKIWILVKSCNLENIGR
jgi:hypothetical protein